MKILITGITGLFGSYLAEEFFGMGEIHGLRRKESKLDLLGDLAVKIKWHEGDISDYLSLEEAFEGMDLIIHVAGIVSYDSKDNEKLIEINVAGTANVVNVMLQKNIPKLLHISSIAALGRNPGFSLIDEYHKWAASPLNTTYGISKYLAELEVWRGAQEGLKVMVFNPSVLLGKLTDQRSSTKIYNYVLQENKFYPLGSINYIDVRDASKMVVLLFKNDNWNQRFILNKESISYQLFFEEVASAFHKKAPGTPVTGLMLDLALLGLRIKGLFSHKSVPVNPQTIKLAKQNITFDNSKATVLTAFNYTPLKSTLGWAAGNSI